MSSEAKVKWLDGFFANIKAETSEWDEIYEAYFRATNQLTCFSNLSVLRALFLSGNVNILGKYQDRSPFTVSDTVKENSYNYNAQSDLHEAMYSFNIRPFRSAASLKIQVADYHRKAVECICKISVVDSKCMNFLTVLTKIYAEQSTYDTDALFSMLSSLRENNLIWSINDVSVSFCKLPYEGVLADEMERLIEMEAFRGCLAFYAIKLCKMFVDLERCPEMDRLKLIEVKAWEVPTIIRKHSCTVYVFGMSWEETQKSNDPHVRHIGKLNQYKIDRLEWLGVRVSDLRDIDYAFSVVDTRTVEQELRTLIDKEMTEVDYLRLHDLLCCRGDPFTVMGVISTMLKSENVPPVALSIINLLNMRFISDPQFVESIKGVGKIVDEALVARAEALA